jgi:hypothetical protein
MEQSRKSLLLIGLLACFVGVYEVSTRTFLPIPFAYFFPGLGLLTVGVFRGWKEGAMVFAFLLGALHDVFGFRGSFLFAGIPLIVLGLRFVSLTVMTNRSVYSVVVLVLLGRFGLWFWDVLIRWVLKGLGGVSGYGVSWSEYWRVSAWDVVFVFLLFSVPVLFQRIFQRRMQRSRSYASVL